MFITTYQKHIQFYPSQKEIVEKRLHPLLYGRCGWLRHPSSLSSQLNIKGSLGKYGERGIRYALIEVGHVGQNLFLQAEALGLGAGIVGAFNDLEVSKVAGLPSKHEPLLIMPVGYNK